MIRRSPPKQEPVMNRPLVTARLVIALLLLASSACGGGGGGPPPTPPPPPPPPTFPISGTVSGLVGAGLVLQDNGGDDLPVAAAAGADVPFTFATQLLAGASWAVTVRVQPGAPAQACTVLGGGSGTVQAAPVTGLQVDCHSARFAYVANANSDGSDSVSMYRVDAATGRLVGMGSLAGGMFPSGVTVDPTGRYAYVLSAETGEVFQYLISPGGLLEPATPPAFSVGSPKGLAIHPSGAYAYAAGPGDVVAQFTVGASGAWSAMIPATLPTGPKPDAVAFDPGGRFAYVANASSAFLASTISQYAVGATGGLTPLAPAEVAAGVWPVSVTVGPTGRFAYVVNKGDSVAAGTISQYAVGAGGTLAPLTPPTVTAGVSPRGLAVDPSGRFAYAVNAGSGSVSQFRIGADGALTPLTPAAVTTLVSPQAIAVDASGRHAWVTCAGSDAVAQFDIGADGALVPNSPSKVPAGPGPGGLTVITGTRQVTPSPTASSTFVANNGPGLIGGNHANTTVMGYASNAGGALSLADTVAPYDGNPVGTGFGAQGLAAHPSGRFLYAITSAFVSQYAIGQGPVLTPLTTPDLPSGSLCTAIAIHPSGATAYVLDHTWVDPTGVIGTSPANTLHPFRIAPDGSLVPFPSPMDAFDIDFGVPNGLAVAPSGGYIYVVFDQFFLGGPPLTGVIRRYAVGLNGLPSNVPAGGAFWAGTAPVAVAIDPSGRFAYVANQLSGDVSAYAIDPASGELSALDCGSGPSCHPNTSSGVADFAAGVAPRGLAIDPGGAHLYVADLGDGIGPGAVSQFAIGPTGALTPLVPASLPAGQNARSVAVDAAGAFVYVANEGDGTNASTVSQYAVGPGGALVPLATATVDAGVRPVALVSSAVFQ
jgi:DNA-binding beta-propeller fold protein YncE